MKWNISEWSSRVSRFFRQNSKVLLLGAAALAVLLLLAGVFGRSKTEESKDNGEDLNTRKATLEKQISQLLSQMEGVGRCEVVITFENSGEIFYAADSKVTTDQSEQDGKTDSKTSVQTEYVTVNSSGKTQLAVLKETCPEIRGVAILCDGGSSARIKTEVSDLVGTLLGLSGDKIAVGQRRSK